MCMRQVWVDKVTVMKGNFREVANFVVLRWLIKYSIPRNKIDGQPTSISLSTYKKSRIIRRLRVAAPVKNKITVPCPV